ncbi:MAG TPA: tetratricopeptide repeat protein [Candidatus Binatia bacterium]
MKPKKTLLPALVLLCGLTVATAKAQEQLLDSLIEKADEHLEAWRAPEAAAILSQIKGKDAGSAKVLDLRAQLAFYQGRYEESLRLSEQALAIDSADEHRQALRLLAQRTRDTVKDLKSYESEHFILRLDESKDGILVSLLLEGLEKTYHAIGKELSFYPQEKVRVEIAPDVSAFNAISTLSLRDIEETGAVGICKFNKVMAISPRTLVHGFRWLDSVSHEYVHYAIVALSNNKAPIWLHEGIARFYETRWRKAKSPSGEEEYLTPSNQTLLARALEKNDFVSFEKMEPSLIYLETPEQVQLAYAEAASAIDYISTRQGPGGVRKLLLELREKPTPEAVQLVMGTPFDQFQVKWQDFLKGKNLQEVEGSRVRKLKVKGTNEGEEESVDLKEIQSVVARNRTHLADRLWARGRIAAATAEYRRALHASPHSMIIMNKLGRVLTDNKRYQEALPYLQKSQALDPDYVGTYVQLGRLYHATKQYPQAREALEEAIQINPFDPAIHTLLFQVYTALGDSQRANGSKAILEKLLSRG